VSLGNLVLQFIRTLEQREKRYAKLLDEWLLAYRIEPLDCTKQLFEESES
jgi:hypothetical protein